MATKTTQSTGMPKQNRQLIFIAIGGIVLLALAFFQGPKVWKQINPPAPAAQPQSSTGGTAGTTGTATPANATLSGSAVIVEPAPRPGAETMVAGVTVSPWQVPQATTGQLWTFSRLQAKDPFVQQVDPSASIAPVARFANSKPTTSTSSSSSSSTTTATSTRQKPAVAVVAAPAEAPTFATIEVNGNALKLKLDQRFPPSTKVFALAGLKPRSAQIVIAGGGSIGKAGKVTLTMGKPLTLVDGATGKRYTMSLLYTGSSPEVVQEFSTKAK